MTENPVQVVLRPPAPPDPNKYVYVPRVQKSDGAMFHKLLMLLYLYTMIALVFILLAQLKIHLKLQNLLDGMLYDRMTY